MNVGIVLDPSHADFNGGALGACTFYWGGVRCPPRLAQIFSHVNH
jgi:hypothetical protein